MIDGKQAGGVDEHSPLIVWCADMQVADPVLTALRQRFDLDLCAALSDVGAGISDADPDILLLCLSPTEALHRAMSAGVPPGAALKDWLAQAQDIIALNRRNRRKVRVLDIDMARDHPAAFLRWFDLPGDEEQIDVLSNDAQGARLGRDEVFHLLAQHALQSDMSARLLRGELEAVSLNFADDPDADADDPDAAFLSYQKMRQAHEQGVLLQVQNRAMQGEVEARNKRMQQLEQDLEQTKETTRQAQEQGALLQAQSRAAQGEAEARSKHMQQLEQDLEQASEESGTLRQQDEILRTQNQLMQQELDILAQARTRLEQRLEQMGQGVESYRVQVAQLQADQSGLKRRNAEKEQALRQAGEMLRGLELQVGHMTQDLEQAAGRQARKQQQLEAAEERLQRFLASKSYRLTAPLRRMRAFVLGSKPV